MYPKSPTSAHDIFKNQVQPIGDGTAFLEHVLKFVNYHENAGHFLAYFISILLRFWVHRFDDLLGTISTWVIGGVDTYHPTDYSNPKTHSRYDSLFSAVCQLLPKQEVEITYRSAEFVLRQQFATAPDYT